MSPKETTMASEQKQDEAPCTVCGETGFHRNYMGETGKRMKETGECFSCAHWGQRADNPPELVIDHYIYSIGPEPGPNFDRRFLGMAGRRFTIEFFDGRKVTTHNLWSGGEVPERFRDRIPNTANFAGGAERVSAGGIICWNPSAEESPMEDR